MREFVGVRSPLDWMIEVGSKRLSVGSLFKREALMFSRIVCPQLGQVVSAFERIGSLAQPLSDQVVAHVEYLKEHGVILDDVSSASGAEFGLLMSDIDFRTLTRIEEPIGRAVIEEIKNAGLEDIIDSKDLTVDEMLPHLSQLPFVIGPLVGILQLMIRKMSIQLKVLNNMDAYPIFSEMIPAILVEQTKKCEVIEIAIKSLPMPDDSVPWEQIIEYRSDPESQSNFLALRHWMSEMARAQLTPAEVEEKLEYLIDQYKRCLELHRMKLKIGTLETLVVAGAHFVTLKWGVAAQTLFSAKRRQIELLEAELSSPGNEVAYIVRAREVIAASTQE
jgi:hypothetical protein